MKTISMLELRQDADRILNQVQKGERTILTKRGKPVARLEPFQQKSFDPNDSFFRLLGMVQAGGSLTNEEIDRTLYGE